MEIVSHLLLLNAILMMVMVTTPLLVVVRPTQAISAMRVGSVLMANFVSRKMGSSSVFLRQTPILVSVAPMQIVLMEKRVPIESVDPHVKSIMIVLG